MSTLRHVIEGIAMLFCASSLHGEMRARGVPELEGTIWMDAFIDFVASGIIWLHRRTPAA